LLKHHIHTLHPYLKIIDSSLSNKSYGAGNPEAKFLLLVVETIGNIIGTLHEPDTLLLSAIENDLLSLLTRGSQMVSTHRFIKIDNCDGDALFSIHCGKMHS
jgi:hypothetical protein